MSLTAIAVDADSVERAGRVPTGGTAVRRGGTILVVDEAPLVRELLCTSLQTAGHRTSSAGTVAAALAALLSERVDLIVAEIAMGGTDGFSFLQSIPEGPGRPRPPVILLTNRGDRESIVQAAKLRVAGYILKSAFSLKKLLARIDDCLAVARRPAAPNPPTDNGPVATAAQPFVPAATLVATTAASTTAEPEPILTEAEARQRIEATVSGRTLAGVVAQVIAQAGSPRSDVGGLAELVGRDAVLSARVLQVANSAKYASSRGMVTSVGEAIRNIGCSAVRNIAAAVGVVDAVGMVGGDAVAAVRAWQHSFAVARLCELLSPAQADGGLPYLTGLCHDLGGMLFAGCFGLDHQKAVAAAAATGGQLAEVERSMLGMTRTEIESAILEKIGLPEQIRRPIRCLNRQCAVTRADESLVMLLEGAKHYANGLLLATDAAALVAPLTTSACKAACGQDAPAAPDAEPFRNEILTLTAMLARLSRDDEAALLRPMFERRDVRVWVARDPGYSAFCPVTAAVRSVTSAVEAHERLPVEGELAKVDVMVVVTRSVRSKQFSPEVVARYVSERVPVLCLVGADVEGAVGPVAVRRTPVSLGELAAFLDGRASRRRAK